MTLLIPCKLLSGITELQPESQFLKVKLAFSNIRSMIINVTSGGALSCIKSFTFPPRFRHEIPSLAIQAVPRFLCRRHFDHVK
jgi:hypothetical protein